MIADVAEEIHNINNALAVVSINSSMLTHQLSAATREEIVAEIRDALTRVRASLAAIEAAVAATVI